MMDDALNPAPQGILSLPTEPEEEGTEIALTGQAPEAQIEEDEDGGVIVILEPESPTSENVPFDANLAEHMEETVLTTLASDLITAYDEDLQSRKDWEETYAEGLQYLGLKVEERTEPWAGAFGGYSSILTEAVVRFQAEAITELFPATGPVKTNIIGKRTREKEEAAARVQSDMNYQLTEVMLEFRPEHEKMLWNLPICGSAFKKVYYDPTIQRQTSKFFPAEDVVLPYGTSEISFSPRVTHRMRKTENELKRLQVSGFYMDIDLGSPTKEFDEIQQKKDEETGFSALYDDRFHPLEMHVELNLPGFEHADGVYLPYVVTILKDNGKILAIRRNWEEGDETYRPRQHFVHYQYVPGFGSYGFGLIHLIGGAVRSVTSLMRQLVDAGTLANLPGGLKTKGLRIKGDDTPISPGEWRDVDIPSGSVRDNIMPLPYKEPSQTLMTLLERLAEETRRFAATADLKISDVSAQAPVGTTLALLERQLKVLSAVQARMHFSMKQELKLLGAIIRDYTDDEYTYEADSPQGAQAKRADYQYTEIIPVSDPNAATMSQRVVQYQAALQLSQQAPQIYNLPRLHRQMLEVLGIKGAERIIELPEDKKPQDPVSENMDILRGKPIKAFAYQDHEAHLMSHMSFMQDPKITSMIGQNPMAQQMAAAMMAHIAEHTAFGYRAQIEHQLGVPLPPLDEDGGTPISAEDEKELAPLIAMAGQQLMLQNQAQAAQQQAQQAQQNPELAIEQRKLELQELEIKRKDSDSQRDHMVAIERLRIENQRLMGELQKGIRTLQQNKELTETKIRADLVKNMTKRNQPPRNNNVR